jgi:hypothetical protein
MYWFRDCTGKRPLSVQVIEKVMRVSGTEAYWSNALHYICPHRQETTTIPLLQSREPALNMSFPSKAQNNAFSQLQVIMRQICEVL